MPATDLSAVVTPLRPLRPLRRARHRRARDWRRAAAWFGCAVFAAVCWLAIGAGLAVTFGW